MTFLLTLLGLLLAGGMAKFASDTLAADPAKDTPGDVCAAQGLMPIGDTGLCTHGDDPVPPGFDGAAVTDPEITGSAAPAAVSCDGDGVSGKRIQVLYARPSNVADRYGTFVNSIRQWSAEADQIYRNSAAQTGGSRALRFVTSTPTGGSCSISVLNIVLSPAGDDNFDKTISELTALGATRTDRVYLVFMDSTVYCGIGNLAADNRRDGANRSNLGPNFARVDARQGCWSGYTAAHELGHNFGAVQYQAANTSLGGHCVDDYDVMCYSDEPLFPTMRIRCTPESTHEFLLDCNKDDYFHTNPPAGSYLDRFWNIAFNRFLIGSTDRSVAPPPPNDAIANAIQMRSRPFTDVQPTLSAGAASSDPRSSCQGNFSGGGLGTVYYKTTPATGGTLTVDTGLSHYDTLVAVFTGSPGNLTERACNDDQTSGTRTILQARASLTVTAGTTYYVMVSGWSAYPPNTLHIRVTGPGEGTATTPRLELDKESSKFNGVVTARATGFAPNATVTLSWPREFLHTGGPYDGAMLDYLISDQTDAAGRATLTFRTPLEPVGNYVVTAVDSEGGEATDTLRVIPRIMLNEEEGTRSTRLRVYLYGFAAGERVEIRWHTGATVSTSYSVLTTVTVAGTGRVAPLVTIPRGASVGRHMIVGKVVGVARSASTPFDLLAGGGSVDDPTTTPSPEPTATATPEASATPQPTATAVPTETSTPEPAPTETPTPEPTATATPVPDASPVADAGEDVSATDAEGDGSEAVALDGSASADPEGGALTYAWTVDGAEVSSEVAPTLTLSVGVTTVSLTVTDVAGQTSTDEVVVTVEPAPAEEPADDDGPAEGDVPSEPFTT